MESSRLQDDLLKEFNAERELIYTQLALLDPLAVSLRKPIASRILSRLYLLVLEALCFVGILALITFCLLRDNIFPFYVLARMRPKAETLGFATNDMNALYWSIVAFALSMALLLFIIARNLAKLRKKNAILQLAAKSIKSVVEEQLHRKAAIDAIDQRHFASLEPISPPTVTDTNMLPNPAI